MGIHPSLLSILVCPKCKGGVHLKENGEGLTCLTCHVMYPIREEIPIMLIDEAVPIS